MRRRFVSNSPPTTAPVFGIIAVCVVIGAAGLFGSGCDDLLIDPFVKGRHFTVFGFLNQVDDEHYVRVVAVRRFPEDIPTPASPHAELDGRVTSTNLTTGEQHVWSHRLARLDDGNYGHLFRASFVVYKGHSYELVVTRSDGVESVAQTTVPKLTDWRVDPAEILDTRTTQTITWMGASTPDNISVSYCARQIGALRCTVVTVPYDRQGRRTEEGWEVEVQLSRDLLFVRQQLGVGEAVQLELSVTEMLFTALDEKWILPEEPFDPEEFAQPDALTNVENGFGFWGSISQSSASWVPEAEVLAISGFVPGGAQSEALGSQ